MEATGGAFPIPAAADRVATGTAEEALAYLAVVVLWLAGVAAAVVRKLRAA